jgi:ribosomal protein S8
MITDLTKLTRNQLVNLLEETGYIESSNEIHSASYTSTNKGQVKYTIKYNDFGVMATGHVFVYIDSNGQLVADY